MFELSDIKTNFTWADTYFTATLLENGNGVCFVFSYNKGNNYETLYIVKEYMDSVYFSWLVYTKDMKLLTNYNMDFQPTAERIYAELCTLKGVEEIILGGDDNGNI